MSVCLYRLCPLNRNVEGAVPEFCGQLGRKNGSLASFGEDRFLLFPNDSRIWLFGGEALGAWVQVPNPLLEMHLSDHRMALLGSPMDYSPPGSSAHGTFQAKVLELGAIAF